jgi:hypothetical protein
MRLWPKFTEAIMYFIVRAKTNPFHSILQLYPGGLIALLVSLSLQESISTDSSIWTPLVLFNAIVGFAGYALRFYAIPHVKTIVFSLLTFMGVLASFGWGYIFADESASLKTLLGATSYFRSYRNDKVCLDKFRRRKRFTAETQSLSQHHSQICSVRFCSHMH